MRIKTSFTFKFSDDEIDALATVCAIALSTGELEGHAEGMAEFFVDNFLDGEDEPTERTESVH